MGQQQKRGKATASSRGSSPGVSVFSGLLGRGLTSQALEETVTRADSEAREATGVSSQMRMVSLPIGDEAVAASEEAAGREKTKSVTVNGHGRSAVSETAVTGTGATVGTGTAAKTAATGIATENEIATERGATATGTVATAIGVIGTGATRIGTVAIGTETGATAAIGTVIATATGIGIVTEIVIGTVTGTGVTATEETGIGATRSAVTGVIEAEGTIAEVETVSGAQIEATARRSGLPLQRRRRTAK